MRKRGRPIYLDDVKKGEVLTILAMGGTRAMAARYVGCTTATIRAEAKRDPQFAARLAKAPDAGELDHLQSIRRAAKEPRYWRAAAWALERTRPERYAPRSPDVVTYAQMRHFIADIVKIVTDEVPARHRKQILQRLDVVMGNFRPPEKSEAK